MASEDESRAFPVRRAAHSAADRSRTAPSHYSDDSDGIGLDAGGNDGPIRSSSRSSLNLGVRNKHARNRVDSTPTTTDTTVQGYLLKYSDGKWNKAWHARYFILDKERGVLSYYKEDATDNKRKSGGWKSGMGMGKQQNNLRGSVDLNHSDAALFYDHTPTSPTKYCFQVRESRANQMKLCTETEADQKTWTEAILASISRKFQDDGYKRGNDSTFTDTEYTANTSTAYDDMSEDCSGSEISFEGPYSDYERDSRNYGKPEARRGSTGSAAVTPHSFGSVPPNLQPWDRNSIPPTYASSSKDGSPTAPAAPTSPQSRGSPGAAAIRAAQGSATSILSPCSPGITTTEPNGRERHLRYERRRARYKHRDTHVHKLTIINQFKWKQSLIVSSIIILVLLVLRTCDEWAFYFVCVGVWGVVTGVLFHQGNHFLASVFQPYQSSWVQQVPKTLALSERAQAAQQEQKKLQEATSSTNPDDPQTPTSPAGGDGSSSSANVATTISPADLIQSGASEFPQWPEGSDQSKNHTWSFLCGSTFRTRIGPDYKKNKKKEFSAPSITKVVCVDLWKTETKARHLMQFLKPKEGLIPEGSFLLLMNCMIPTYSGGGTFSKALTDGPGLSIVMWCIIDKETMAETETSMQGHHLLLRRLLNANNLANPASIYERFKMIGRLANVDEVGLGPIQKGLINRYNATPILTRPQHEFHRGTTCDGVPYLEVDIDVHKFSKVARDGLVRFGGLMTQLLIDWSFVIEGHDNDELPEVILCCARLNYPNRDGALPWPGPSSPSS